MAMQSQFAPIDYKEGLRLGQTRVVTESVREVAVQKERMRTLIVPREHGAWGLLFVPLFTGIVAGLAAPERVWTMLLFTAAALFLFWLRTPVESLLGTGVIVAHTAGERRTALLASCVLAAASAGCLAGLLWRGQNAQLVGIGLIAALALGLQAALRRLGRHTRMASQLVGAFALTATAPAAYYLGSGHFGRSALALWIANWCFACDQIHFVQLRIHAGRASGVAEKFARGKLFFAGQFALLAVLIFAAFDRLVPALVFVAFIPALVRGTRWFFQEPEPINVKKLGWSELRQGIIFGILLALAFRLG